MPHSQTLTHLLRPFQPYFDDASIEEIIVNRPGEVWIWRKGAFECHEIALDADDIIDIGIVAGAQRRQDVGPDKPLLATDLQGMGRLQVVLPPCVADGKPSLVIRRGNAFSPSLDDLAIAGLFKSTKRRRGAASLEDDRLLRFYQEEDWPRFLREAVLAKKTIVTCGETASGKTTVAKGLINAIPLNERLITIEDTPEWTDLPHRNQVNLFYSKDSHDVTPRHLVAAALRMRIGRLLVQELRDGDAAFAFLRAVKSGHRGGVTTVHSDNPEAAFMAIAVQMKETEAGASLDTEDVLAMLRQNIDVIAHCIRTDVDGITEFKV
ncbi:MAG TPA: P-type DNA transfer ATPase VirB11, partial [Caldimonas sp.]|nr:P-type DNA transfer ATPase VirB11 [Caldimonas sp.]